MAQFETAAVRRKINPAWVALGIFAAACVAVPAWMADAQYKSLSAEAVSLRSQLKKGDAQIQSDPMYLRLKAYGASLAAADALSKWKEAQPAWYVFLRDVAAALPKDVTVGAATYSPESSTLSLQLTAPTPRRVIQAIGTVEDMEGLSKVRFGSIVAEKVAFPGDRAQYVGYGAKVDAVVDRAWLSRKYAQEEALAKARRASLAPQVIPVPAKAASGTGASR